MLRIVVSGALLGALFAIPVANAQQPDAETIQISWTSAVELARRQSPQMVVARASGGEAASHVEAARVWRTNPRVMGSSGPRFGGSGTSVDVSLGLEQPIVFGGTPALRVDVAEALAQSEAARAAEVERVVLGDLAVVYTELLYWKERRRLAVASFELAEEVERVARRRHEVGDVGGLDASVAALARASAASEVSRADARLVGAQGRLKLLLGIGPRTAIEVDGELESFGAPATGPADAPRPEVTRLMAQERAAAASEDLARARRLPTLTAGVEYAREEQANIVLAVLSLTLPFFDRGQGELAEASARRVRVQAEVDEAVAVVALEVATAQQRVQTLQEAADRFAREGLDALQHAERVATASYTAGAMDLPELLAVRRELALARNDFATLLLELALARVELIASTSAW